MRDLNQNELQTVSGASVMESVQNGCSYAWDAACSAAYNTRTVAITVGGGWLGGFAALTFLGAGAKAFAEMTAQRNARTAIMQNSVGLYIAGGIVGAKLAYDYIA